MHVTQQIADAIVTRISTIPAFDGRVYRRGAVGWDFRTFPFCVVRTGETKTETEASSRGARTGRQQVHATKILVVVEDLETAGDDYVAKLGDIAIAVEMAITGFDGLSLDDFTKTSDSGVTDIESDFDGVHSGQILGFQATYRTLEGRPDQIF